MGKNARLRQTRKMINGILMEKVPELKQEIYRQLNSAPLKSRLIFAFKVIFKKL